MSFIKTSPVKINKIFLIAVLAIVLPLSIPISAIATVNYGPVKKGETLWSIAKTHRPKHVSIHQMMQAIQNLNGPLMQDSQAIHQGQTLILPENIQEVRSALHPVTASSPTSPVVSPAVNPSAQLAQAPASNTPAANTVITNPANPMPNLTTANANTASSTVSNTVPAAPALSISTLSNSNPANSSPINSTNTANPAPSSFPWGWASVVVLLLALAYLIWQRKLSGNLPSDIKKLAALRLGISSKRHEPSTITRYKTRRFKEGLDLSPDQDFGLSPEEGFNQASPYSTHPASFSHQSAEAMASAMIDIAEKNYDGAERLLKSAITQDQNNLELRVKLLELYMTTNNQNAFKKESEQVEQMVPENSPVWHQVRGMYLNQWAYDA